VNDCQPIIPPTGAPAAGGDAIPVAAARGMVWIAGGEFTMGSDRHYPEERPERRVHADGFWIDETPVTNRKFAEFVTATGYRTFAEIPPRAEDYPGAPPENLRAGSMVFVGSSQPVRTDRPEIWWDFIHDADWRHPTGPESTLDGLEDHPVVHLALVDIEAYCDWAGTALPTEREWEFAARAGLDDAEFAWGDELEPDGVPQANTWQGTFPYHNSLKDGWLRTSPVRTFGKSRYGLYDMIGNVWEWTTDWWSEGAHETDRTACCSVKRTASAAGGDPLGIPRRVLKGGSHLCAPNYCRRYRPAARHAHPIDTSTSHVGFRCIVRPPAG
jgi:formylglycine-generating enzyme required for sulfatase activity